MAYINWKETYEIGFKIIDEQHQKLIEYMNELYYAQTNGTGQYLVSELLEKLADYTHYHFATEKNLFEQYEYPTANEHIIEHNYFIEQIETLQREIAKNNLLLSLKTLDFLKDWTINHILGTDQEFGDYVHSREFGETLKVI